MSKKIIFLEDYSYDIDDRTRHNIPAGWSGEVCNLVADDAIAKGKASEVTTLVIDDDAIAKGKASKSTAAISAP